MKSTLFALLLVGCLGPDTTEQCVTGRTTSSNTCEQELDTDAKEDIEQSCARQSGFAQSKGCAVERKDYLDCQNEAIVSSSCESLLDDVALACSYELGRYEGCIDAS